MHEFTKMLAVFCIFVTSFCCVNAMDIRESPIEAHETAVSSTIEPIVDRVYEQQKYCKPLNFFSAIAALPFLYCLLNRHNVTAGAAGFIFFTLLSFVG